MKCEQTWEDMVSPAHTDSAGPHLGEPDGRIWAPLRASDSKTALLLVHGPGGVDQFPLQEHTWIGRRRRNTVQINDPRVSADHCLVYLDATRGHVLRDLKSRNGTHVNGKPVEDEVVLRGSDEIRIGGTHLFYLAAESSPADAPEVSREDSESHIHTTLLPQPITSFLPAQQIRSGRALRGSYEKLRVTYELQRDIALYESIDVTLGRMLERTFEFLDYDHGVVLLLDRDGELRPRAHKVREGMGRAVISSTVLKHVQRERTGIISTDATVDGRFRESRSLLLHGVRSTIASPILDGEELLGVVIVDSVACANAFNEKDLQLIGNIANQVAQILKNSMLHEELRLSFDSSIRTLAATVDARHPLTAGHSERVTVYALLIGEELGLDVREREILQFAALLHDIGKIGVSDRVLLKDGKFTDGEREEMQTHPEKTRTILEKFHFPSALRDVPAVASAHHEKADGSGYPWGLTGSEIPPLSRILAVGDVFDALSSHRDYPKYHGEETLGNGPMPLPKAITIIRGESGRSFDPDVVQAFLRCLPRALLRFRGTHFPPDYVDETIREMAPELAE